MSTNNSDAIGALVVGAGPTGLTMACELTRHGVPCRIIDQADAPSIWSKAQVIHSRSLEVFEDMGVARTMLERGKELRAVNVFSPEGRRVLHVEIAQEDTAFRHPLSLSQRDTELLLIDRLGALGVPVEREVKLTGFTQDSEGVTAALEHAGGRREEVRTPWLLGCDGAHSTVRHTLGIELSGDTYEWCVNQADIHIQWPTPVADDEIIVFLSPDGPLGAFPLPGAGRYRLLAIDDETEPTLTRFQELLDTRAPKGAVASDPLWMVQFKIHCRMVDRYREGRAFLAGDAAHIHSPAGGQGMNTGIQDAYNLAWKLALVHQGVARPSLLDSYEPERKPVAAAVLRGSDAATRGTTVLQWLRGPLAQALRDQVVHFVGSLSLLQQRASRAISELDVAYLDSPAVGQHRTSVLTANVVPDPKSEAPALRDWFAFGDGPAPGARVPDLHFTAAGGEERRVHDLLRGGRHTLLLFDGAAPTESGYQNLAKIARSVADRFGARFQIHIIVPRAERPEALSWEGSVILDAEGALHRAFFARSECLYLVRPDGYVGFRSQPAIEEALRAFLDRHFSG